jgi:galactose mutarotase-like enzyme
VVARQQTTRRNARNENQRHGFNQRFQIKFWSKEKAFCNYLFAITTTLLCDFSSAALKLKLSIAAKI